MLISLSPEHNRGVSRILDSIAIISISQAQGEVVAVAVKQTNTDIKLIVASNNTLPASTIIHLKSVWDILKRLCQDYQDYNVVPDHTKYPKRPSTKSTKPRLCPMILRFNNQKLRRQISKHFMDFVSINQKVAKKRGLKPMSTQLKALRPALDLDALSDKFWAYVWTAHCPLDLWESDSLYLFHYSYVAKHAALSGPSLANVIAAPL